MVLLNIMVKTNFVIIFIESTMGCSCPSHGGESSKYDLAPKPAAGSEIQVGLVSRNPYNRAVAKLNKQAPSKVISINPLDEDAPL